MARVTVRPATEADLPAIVALAQAQSAEIYPDLPLDGVRVGHLASWLLAHPDRGMVAVLADEETCVGSIAALLSDHAMTGERTATELCWFVDPAVRGGSGAFRLLTHYETWASAVGADRIQLSAPIGFPDAVCRRRGYRSREVTYDKRLTYPR